VRKPRPSQLRSPPSLDRMTRFQPPDVREANRFAGGIEASRRSARGPGLRAAEPTRLALRETAVSTQHGRRAGALRQKMHRPAILPETGERTRREGAHLERQFRVRTPERSDVACICREPPQVFVSWRISLVGEVRSQAGRLAHRVAPSGDLGLRRSTLRRGGPYASHAVDLLSGQQGH
jgi:hypothetical protein